jgi:glycosyltransferase involved in cell wall biosynthesis
MMAIFVKREALRVGTRKIVFMARDGRVIKKAFDRLYDQEISEGALESKYLHLSRATVIAATLNNPLSPNDIYFLSEGLHLAQQPVQYFLEKAGLSVKTEKVVSVAKRFFKSVSYIPTSADQKSLSDMFNELSDLIWAANKASREALLIYLQQHDLLDSDRLILVDVGWLLNIQARLSSLLKSAGKHTELIGCYVGSRDRAAKEIIHSTLLFKYGEPYGAANLIEKHTTLFEVLFSSPEASSCRIDRDGDTVVVGFTELATPPSSEFLAAQKIQFGAEMFHDHLAKAKEQFFPDQVSGDYFLKLFETLVKTENPEVTANLGNFEVRLGGHHEFVVVENLLDRPRSSTISSPKREPEYFDPIRYEAKASVSRALIVTSAGLHVGSTRYRALYLAESLRNQGVSCTVIHSATDMSLVRDLVDHADLVVFQRCFEKQGNVGAYLRYARRRKKRCIAEMDDLVLPKFIDCIGSVKGGQWNRDEARHIAVSYGNLIEKVDGCIVSTPLLKSYIESTYRLPAAIVRNKILPQHLQAPREKTYPNLRLLYASGTLSHRWDFAIIENQLFDFLTLHQQVSLSVLGSAQVPGRILALPNVSNYPLLPYTQMLNFVSAHDLTLIPLADDEFNQAKSNVKFVECAAVGVPVLASRVSEYEYAIQHKVNGLLAETPEQWGQLLEWVFEKPERLNGLAQRAYKCVKDNYTTSVLEGEAVQLLTKV